MKKNYLWIAMVFSLFVWNGLSAQQRAGYTLAEQAQLDSIKQTYLDMGIPEEWASKRAETVFESKKKVTTRSSVYTATPVAGSIWLDRDSITGAPNASHAHNFTPEEFVKDIFVKGGRDVADQAIRNVTLISSSWTGSMTDTWNSKGYMGPYGGDAGTWTSNNRELLYFDHGDNTTTIPGWDGSPVPVFGLYNGFLLSTGPGLLAEGTNIANGALGGGFVDWTTIGGGIAPTTDKRDPDLSPIAAPNPVQTLTSLEFDFRSFTDSVTFQYVFASEEYPDFANSSVNDAFGFFISGPGLTDDWGNSGDTINIARYPNGLPITINNSNWGHFGSYHSTSTPQIDAVNPQYHVPIYVNSSVMEYDGHSIVLTAKAKLQRGVWYHLKLAIGNVGDQIYGSGVFLKAGSLDLGAPESDVPRPYATAAYDSIYGWNSLYADCLNTINLKFDPSTSSQDIYVWSDGSGADFVYDSKLNKFFNDSIKYVIPANDSTLSIQFKVSNEVKNGSQVRFLSMLQGSVQKDTTDIFDLYAKSEIKLIKYTRPTANYAGILDIQTTNGSPYIQRSLNGGLTWEFARDTITGAMKPFSKSQIANLASEDNAYIIYREPNTCSENDTIFIGKGTGEPVILRVVTMPVISGATVDKEPGEHTINSTDDFTFTITPTGNNANLQLVVTTSRTSIPDSEGVIIVKNADGSYTVTIRYIQEPVEIYIDFATSNIAIRNNKIWANGSMLYMQTNQAKQAQVYTIAGALVQTVNLTSGETESISLSKGFYIVAVDDFTYKVIIK